jgi:hypothetical protein
MKHVDRLDGDYELRSRLGGVVASVLATRPKLRRFKPGQGDEFLRAIKIRSTPYSRMGSNAGGPCCKILWHVKELLKSHRDR